MIQLLKEEAEKYGDRLQVIKIEHLEDLKRGIEEFKNTEELNGFQKWIVNDLYHFSLPVTGFEVRSIIIMALYHPISADIELEYHGKVYYARGLVRAEFNRARQYLTELLSQLGYHAYEISNLPMKRMAVQSGLAVYGRNNITYVEELGSNVSYLTFYSDLPCNIDEWRKLSMSDTCSKCGACISLCPTGAIRQDRFLIDNQRCLSSMNEAGGNFPEWLPKNVHHTLYDCLRCQEHCRLNSKVAKDTIGSIRITEEETEMLLQGKGPEDFSQEFLWKVRRLALFDWKDGLPRNIRAIIEAAE